MSDRFEFNAENQARARTVIARYPEGRQQSAVMPLLDLAQRQSGGWLGQDVIEAVAGMLGMPHIRVLEVATFYTMYNLKPVGRHQINICTTTPCWLRGSADIVAACETALGVQVGETTGDGEFTLREVECMGACVNAPMAQIGDDYYEDLDADSITRIIDALKRGERPAPGSQTGRQTSAPEGGPLTLTGEAAKPPGRKTDKRDEVAEASETEAGDIDVIETEVPDIEASETESSETEASETEAVEAEAVEADASDIDDIETEAAEIEPVEAEAVETETVETEASEAEASDVETSEPAAVETEVSDIEVTEPEAGEPEIPEAGDVPDLAEADDVADIDAAGDEPRREKE